MCMEHSLINLYLISTLEYKKNTDTVKNLNGVGCSRLLGHSPMRALHGPGKKTSNNRIYVKKKRIVRHKTVWVYISGPVQPQDH